MSEKGGDFMGLPIYDNIDKLLKERGMSRRQLAIKAGIGEGTISTAFTRRSTMFHPRNLQKIADVLDVTIEDLIAEPVTVTTLGKIDKSRLHDIGVIKHIIDEAFSKLNMHGKIIAMERIKELTQIPSYTEQK